LFNNVFGAAKSLFKFSSCLIEYRITKMKTFLLRKNHSLFMTIGYDYYIIAYIIMHRQQFFNDRSL